MNLKSHEDARSEHYEDTGRELAAWLQEVGRRKWHSSRLPATGRSPAEADSREDVIRYLEDLAGREIRSREDVRRCFGELWARDRDAGQIYRRRQLVKESLLLLGLVVAYVQYYFWDVNLRIARLPSTITFISAESRSPQPHVPWQPPRRATLNSTQRT